jgi:hypothetical protein
LWLDQIEKKEQPQNAKTFCGDFCLSQNVRKNSVRLSLLGQNDAGSSGHQTHSCNNTGVSGTMEAAMRSAVRARIFLI